MPSSDGVLKMGVRKEGLRGGGRETRTSPAYKAGEPGTAGGCASGLQGVGLGEDPAVGESEWVKGHSPGCSERGSLSSRG